MNRRRGANEGSIYKRKSDGKWVGAVTVGWMIEPDGTRRRERRVFYGSTRSEVARALTKALREHQTGTLPTAGSLTVRDYVERWIKTKRMKLRPSTHRTYEGIIRHHVVPELGAVRLERLMPTDVEAMMQRRLAAGCSAARVHDMRSVLRTALTQAVRDGLISRNAAALAEGPKVDERRVTTLTPLEALTFLDSVARERLEALYRVALAVGLRRGEALGLRWEDVDLEGRRLRVVYALQRVDGRLVLVPPKTKRSRREVSLPEAVVEALRSHRTRQLEERLLAGARWRDEVPVYGGGSKTGLVFTTTIGTPLDGTMVTEAFQAALRRAGLRKIRFHDLRHSCASLLLAQGVPARVVMEVLGHSTITLTMNTYSHVMPSLLDDAAAAMDRALAPQPV
jgi:integrase